MLDFNGDDVLRGAVADLEARNRQLQAANKRLRVEAVRRGPAARGWETSGGLPSLPAWRPARPPCVVTCMPPCAQCLFSSSFASADHSVLLLLPQEAARDDLQDTTEKMIVAQAQRDKLRQRLQVWP